MYGKGAGSLTDEFLKYTRDRRYTLRSLPEVLEVLKKLFARSKTVDILAVENFRSQEILVLRMSKAKI